MISIVIPVLNESDSLGTLHEELSLVAAEQGYDLEIIFVDDGSTDGSWAAIQALARDDARVHGIRLRRNFGKSSALDAGIETARGEIVFTMDADLQDDPRELPRFLQMMQEGYDVVSGWKRKRFDPWHKVIPSRVFNWMVSRLTRVPLHDHNCGFKSYRRAVFDEIELYGELHRFVPVLAAARGWRVAELEVHHRPRRFGLSKYGLSRIPKGFLDLLTVKLLTGYGQRPQHLLGMFGLLAFTVGAVGITLLTVGWCATRFVSGWQLLHLHERAIFFYSLAALLLGSQFMSVGFLAELITAMQMRQRKSYSVSETTGQVDE